MENLIIRIEALDEPSRELDAEIYALVLPVGHRAHPYLAATFIDDTLVGRPYQCPQFTSSIDAAMTVVPLSFRLAALYQDPSDDLWACSLSNREAQIGRGGVRCYAAKSAACAVLAAALKAINPA